MSPSELTNTIEQFTVYVHRNEAHFTYIYVYHTNVSEADIIYKNPHPNVIPHIFLLFLFRSGAPPMTLLTAGALTDPRLSATASNVCTTEARLGGVGRVPTPPPPPTKTQATPVTGDSTLSTVAPGRWCSLKLKFSQYSSIHTNYIIPHCTTLQYNHTI